MRQVQEPQSAYQMERMSPEDQHYLICKRQYDLAHSEIQRGLTLIDGGGHEEGAEVVELHAKLLAGAALMLGDHATARIAAEFSGELEFVERAIAAIEIEDSECCGCVHTVEVELPNKQLEERAAENYLLEIPMMWSDAHGCTVGLRKCFKCGHLNATPQPMTQHHEQVEMARSKFPRENEGHDSVALPRLDVAPS